MVAWPEAWFMGQLLKMVGGLGANVAVVLLPHLASLAPLISGTLLLGGVGRRFG